MKGIKFKVTVEYVCPNMLSNEQLKNDFNNDVVLAYKYISDNYNDSALNFSESEKVVKVEIVE